jgi:type IV secretion system protein TrbL
MTNPTASHIGIADGLAPHGQRVVALSWGDLNPLSWLGSAASAAIGDVWKAAMTALWSAGLWVLELAFKIIDAFTTPDLSSSGPLASVLPYTFAIGGFVAGLMALIQIGIALYRRDGQSIARVMVGAVQFGAVWIGYLVIAATLVTATAGLTTGLLQGLLHVDAFSGFFDSASWPRNIDDTVVATVLGLCTVFIVFPAAIGYILIMLVREAALLLLTATSPIAAGGLLSEGTRVWFWKSLRWFLATLLISPLAALILGIGVQITEGTVQGNGDQTAAAVGMAVTGCILILIGAICPLILFRLLAFVDPGTSSGAAMRQAFAANGGVAGMLSGKAVSGGGGSSGSGAATKHDGGGRSQGEATADTQTASRFSSILGGAGQLVGAGMQAAGTIGSKAATIGSDVLGGAGVGHQASYYGQDSTGAGAAPGGGRSSGASGSGSGGGAAPGTDPSGDPGPGGGSPADGGAPGGGQPPTPPTPPIPPASPTSPMPPGGGGVGAAPPGGGSGAGAAGAAAEVPVVPV